MYQPWQHLAPPALRLATDEQGLWISQKLEVKDDQSHQKLALVLFQPKPLTCLLDFEFFSKFQLGESQNSRSLMDWYLGPRWFVLSARYRITLRIIQTVGWTCPVDAHQVSISTFHARTISHLESHFYCWSQHFLAKMRNFAWESRRLDFSLCLSCNSEASFRVHVASVS